MANQRIGGERLDVRVHMDSSYASSAVAEDIMELVRTTSKEGRKCVLGLATGSTPMQIYRHLVKGHQRGLSFSHVVTYNLDEYYPMASDALQSYHRFMHEHLFDHIDIEPSNIHIPDGAINASDLQGACDLYDNSIGESGLDLQLLGLGRCGHIGFNERGSSSDSKTRLVTLDKVTRIDAASDFFGEENVPRQAITMGLQTIMQAKRILIVAFGENKVGAVQDAVERPISEQCAASILQKHGNTLMHLDIAAANGNDGKSLMVAEVVCSAPEYINQRMERKAVTWLAEKLGKPISKLEEDDYLQNSLTDLVLEQGSYLEINTRVLKHLQAVITEWPGGEPKPLPAFHIPTQDQDAALKNPAADRILIMSPHPDDDVISCGGTFIRLVQQGKDVSVAYQTSGNIAVSDEEALRFAEFGTEYGLAGVNFGKHAERLKSLRETIRSSLKLKKPGEPDCREVQEIKTMIRYSEAKSAARVCGCNIDNLHFLNMPFYETGAVVKKPLSQHDIDIIVQLLEDLRPQQLYVAGDLSDPHGTHRTCLQAIMLAIEAVKGQPWFKDCQVWLYRGAWQEFEPHEIEMAVPMSPADVKHKTEAIFRHQSQKDWAMFPGADPREFWQRARDRNKATADAFRMLGLAEYEAMEAFVQYRGHTTDSESPYFSGTSLADL